MHVLGLGNKPKLRHPLTRTSSFLRKEPGCRPPFRAHINRRSELHPISFKKHTDLVGPTSRRARSRGAEDLSVICRKFRDRRMPIDMPRGLPFAVDTWGPSSRHRRHRFLTHAHRDHLVGAGAAAADGSGGTVYATRLTLALALRHFPQVITPLAPCMFSFASPANCFCGWGRV